MKATWQKRGKAVKGKVSREASDVLDSVLVDLEFDEVKQVDLEEVVGRGHGTSNYD